jgi:iron complex outermembrane receptor protein
MPEHLRAVQLTPTINLLDGKLSNTFNVYYNQVYEVIVRDVDPNSTIKYKNSGSLETIGVEDEIAFIQNFYRARANFTFQYVIDSENVDAADWRIYNIPPFIANVILDVNPFGRYYRYAWVNLTGRFLSEQLAPIRTKMPPEAGSTTPTDLVDLNHTTGPYFLLNIGVHLSKVFIDELFLDATVYNLLDTKVYQGGSTAHPYPMAGRFFMTYLRYLF